MTSFLSTLPTPEKGQSSISLANIKPTRQEIQHGVYLYTYRVTEPTRFHYEVECLKYQRLSLTITFEGSDNIEFQNNSDPDNGGNNGTGGLAKTVIVEPFQRVTVGTLRLVDPYLTAQLKVGYTMKVLRPEARHISSALQRDRDDIDVALHGSSYANLNQRQTLREINMACVEHDVNFVDVAFPPLPPSLIGTLATTTAATNTATKEEEEEGAEALVELISQSTLKEESKNTWFEDHFIQNLNAMHGGITWRRPADFMGNEYDVFRRVNGALGGGAPSVSSSDIREGQLGDYWLMSALSVIAERPHLIHRLFQSPSESTYSEQFNQHGAYKLWLTKNGERTSVLVDDYVPCTPGGGPVFSRSNDNTLWVSLVEKAMAKLHGGYVYLKNSMQHRFTHEGLTDLTGAPTTNIRFDEYRTDSVDGGGGIGGGNGASGVIYNRRSRRRSMHGQGTENGDDGSAPPVVHGVGLSALSDLWEDILEYHQAGHLMCVTSYGENNSVSTSSTSSISSTTSIDDEIKENLKIARAKIRGDFIPAHSYCILNVHQVETTGERLVHVRNPWSRLCWTGDWSRSSSKWNDATRSEMNSYAPNVFTDEEPANGGGVALGDSFWMKLEDAVELFESMSVCRVGSVNSSSAARRRRGKENQSSKKKKKPKKQKNKTKGHREGGTATGSLSRVLGGDGASVFSSTNSTTTATNESSVWSECRVRGTFSTSNADEDVRTNMYLLDVPPDTSEMIVQLHQRDRTCLGERDYVDIGLTVLSLSEDGNTYRMIPGGSTGCQLAREVCFVCCCLMFVVCGVWRVACGVWRVACCLLLVACVVFINIFNVRSFMVHCRSL